MTKFQILLYENGNKFWNESWREKKLKETRFHSPSLWIDAYSFGLNFSDTKKTFSLKMSTFQEKTRETPQSKSVFIAPEFSQMQK